MPVLLAALSKIGIAAMLWVGGHILLVGAHELGWDAPYDIVHDLEGLVDDAGGASGVLTWLVNTAASAVIGLAVGLLVTTIAARVPTGGDPPEPPPPLDEFGRASVGERGRKYCVISVGACS